MNSLVDSDIQRFVACLVLGYLENQQLQKAYDSFCETSRHLTKEKKGLRYGNKPLDTSVGLVNIIRDYFTFKSRINELLRLCPLSPIVIRLIDTDDSLQRLEIILEKFKDNLGKIDKVPAESSKKRKHEKDDVFEISQSNTSTPETAHPAKRLKKSLTTPFLMLSGNKENKSKTVDKSKVGRLELDYQNSSSSDTSNKEDDNDDNDDEEMGVSRKTSSSPHVLKTNPEQLSEKFLQKPDFVDKVVDIINRTRSAKDTELTSSKEVQENGLTSDDLQDILSKTQNDPSFDEIVNDIVNKYLLDYPEADNTVQTSTSSDKLSDLSNEFNAEAVTEIPIKQRLRPRSEKKTPIAERKKKINIISNEPYTGVVPAAANLPQTTLSVPPEVEQVEPEMQQHVFFNIPAFVQNRVEMVPVLQSASLSSSSGIIPLETSLATTDKIPKLEPNSNDEKPDVKNMLKSTETDKKESTPKVKMHPSFLESKCKSTPRRKATHIRILDFNHTPSNRKLSMIREFSTPTSRILTTTPGSAPATIASCKIAMKPQELESVIDDNSNSNSISNTPKVAKNRRQRKIAISKSAEKKQQSDELNKPVISHDDWFSMRQQSKALPIDQQVRNANEKAEAEGKIQRPKRRTLKRRAVKKKVSTRTRKSLTKSPDEQKENKEKNGSEENSTSIECDENKPLIKFKIKSPRKTAATLRKTPKKKKKSLIERSKEKVEVLETKEHKKKKKVESALDEADEGPSSLNRSDTVQEVATMLTTLSETILAKTSNTKSVDESLDRKNQPDSGIDPNPMLETPFKGFIDMLETPFKEKSLTPLPNTPRFAIPLISQSAQETPMPKIFSSTNSGLSLDKICNILTPAFPITPGIKETPLKDGLEGSPTSASGYSSRRTDYSSCSSYYKPDESEDINPAFLNPQRRSDRTSQSESDVEKPLKITRSAKKVECPGAIERVKSYNEEKKAMPTPHYTMMDEGLLSESMITTATDDSSDSSSSFTCSTCSTDPSDDENTMEKLNKVVTTTDIDSEWHCDDAEKEATSSPALMNEKTGEVRFPLRNWITPKKLEVDERQEQLAETNTIKCLPNKNDPRRGISIQEEHERRLQQLKEVRQRTLDRIRMDSAVIKQKVQQPPHQKFKKNNVKTFKLPSEEAPKPTVVSRKEQILQQNLTERPRPTPLKLILSSSSRRKNATPRKTIVIDELPRQPSPIKKKKEKKVETSYKSPAKLDRLSLESVNDNAVMPEASLYTSLNISSSFTTSFEDETASTIVVANKTVRIEDGSNTLQRILVAQGFEKNETKELQSELIDKQERKTNCIKTSDSESGSDEDSDENNEEEELDFVSAEEMKKTEFMFVEAEHFQQKAAAVVDLKISPMIVNLEGIKITLNHSGLIEVFTIDPTPESESKQKEKCSKYKSPKKSSDEKSLTKSNGKGSPIKNDKVSKVTEIPDNQSNSQENFKEKQKIKINIKEKEKNLKNPSHDINSTDIRAVLDKLHGK